jgi:hypothetical protein
MEKERSSKLGGVLSCCRPALWWLRIEVAQQSAVGNDLGKAEHVRNEDSLLIDIVRLFVH